MKKEIHVLPTMDLLFKKLLTSKDSTHILKAFVRDILGKEFKTLTPRETYHIDSYKKEFDADPELMRTEVDILAETEDGSHVTIEMQVQPHDFFIERAIFYLGEAYRSSLGNQEIEDFIKSNNFSALRPTYGMNIVDFHLFDKHGLATRKFGILDLDSHELLRSTHGDDLIIICFFSLVNTNIDRNSPAYLWQQFFKTGKVPDDAPRLFKGRSEENRLLFFRGCQFYFLQ
ncbi:Rpn family recombination-promoting nuclease/putative transposase [Enterococcus sp. AZ109]|uniref:Rpn family recombination-promoting nuclease/putative transposase n=1 Tax=Enterococcus sp. AZ109 TaxID=2774634 RepID=UPI003F26F055